MSRAKNADCTSCYFRNKRKVSTYRIFILTLMSYNIRGLSRMICWLFFFSNRSRAKCNKVLILQSKNSTASRFITIEIKYSLVLQIKRNGVLPILQWISLVRRRQMPSKSDTVVMIDEERVLAAIDEDTVKSYAMNEAAVITDTNWKDCRGRWRGKKKTFQSCLQTFQFWWAEFLNFEALVNDDWADLLIATREEDEGRVDTQRRQLGRRSWKDFPVDNCHSVV